LIPTTFDICLLRTDGRPVECDRLRAALGELPLYPAKADPSRCLYRAVDTGVYFQVLLAPELIAWSGESEDEFVEDDADRDAMEDESGPIEMPPVTLTIPLVSPSFFGREALNVAGQLVAAGNLTLGHAEHQEPGGETGEGGASSPEEILANWDEANRRAAAAASDGGEQTKSASRVRPTVWSRAAADAWWAYGRGRAALDAELALAGVKVPRLQAAWHEGRIKSLSTRDIGTSTVLPRTDLVLVRRQRERRGLLFSRRVLEEGIVSGERLWEILAAASELREEPVRLLIYREARFPPPQVAAALEVLDLEPLANARQTDLVGVVDFDSGAALEGEA